MRAHVSVARVRKCTSGARMCAWDGIAVRALGASHVLALAAKQGAQIAMRICAPKASRSGIAVRTLGAVHVLARVIPAVLAR